MTKYQREFEKELARLQRSVSRLTKQSKFYQTVDLPTQPKRVTKRMIKSLKELKGKHFVAEVDIETGEVLRTATAEQIYEKHPRLAGFRKSYYDPEYARRYRQEHREEINARQREYRKAHREEINARQRAYRQAHREEINARARERRQANREEINARQRERYAQNYIPTFTVLDEIIERFRQAEQEIIAQYDTSFYGKDIITMKLRCIRNLISTIESRYDDRDGIYSAHLKKNEERIAELLTPLIYDSDQTNVDASYTELLIIVRQDRTLVSSEYDSDLSQYIEDLMESGEY